MRPWTGTAARWSCKLILVASTACVAPAPAAAPRPVTEAPIPAAIDPLSAPWIPEVTRGSVTQQLQLEATLVSRIDTVERRDTIRTALTAEWSRVTGDGALRISGLVTSFRVSSDTSEPSTPTGILLPLPFTALDADGALPARLVRPEPSGCGLDAAAALGVREFFLSMPRRLEPGTAWSDSSRYTICRDSIPLSVESVREFRVTGAERRARGIVVLVERRSRVTMRGEGKQFGESIVIEAGGDGQAQLAVRLTGAFIEAGSGESTLRMTMRGRRRSQELTQHTRLAILTP